MSKARQAILARMRHALNRDSESEDHANQVVKEKLRKPSPTLLPRHIDLDQAGKIALFTKKAETVQANVIAVKTFADLPEAIADYLRQHNLPLSLVAANNPNFNMAQWNDGLWEICRGKPSEKDPVGLTMAKAGIAETGTLVLASDHDHPTTLAFLPETSIIALEARNIHGAYEHALAALREKQALPRSVNLITGPSRSGDIEQTLQLGAHGPKRLLVVLVDDANSSDSALRETGPASPDQ